MVNTSVKTFAGWEKESKLAKPGTLNHKSEIITLFPISNTDLTVSLIPWCSNAKKVVFKTIHRVINNSNNGSLTIL